jgi:hypothetical protein
VNPQGHHVLAAAAAGQLEGAEHLELRIGKMGLVVPLVVIRDEYEVEAQAPVAPAALLRTEFPIRTGGVNMKRPAV